LSQEESDYLYRLGVDYDEYIHFYEQYKDVVLPEEIDPGEKTKEDDLQKPEDTSDDPDSKTDPEKETPTDNTSDNSISPELRQRLKEKLGLTDEQIDKMF